LRDLLQVARLEIGDMQSKGQPTAARPPPSRTGAKAVRPAGASLTGLAFRIYG